MLPTVLGSMFSLYQWLLQLYPRPAEKAREAVCLLRAKSQWEVVMKAKSEQSVRSMSSDKGMSGKTPPDLGYQQ